MSRTIAAHEPRTTSPRRVRHRRRLSGRPRRLLRAGHVVVAGGWLGLVVAMLVLGLLARWGVADVPPADTYRLMAVVGSRVIPLLAVTTMFSGVALSLLTTWGLVRHWWVVVKIVLGLVVIVSAVTLTDAWLAQAAASPDTAGAGVALVASSLAHLAMLTTATVVSVDKPCGRTPRGRRAATRSGVGPGARAGRASKSRVPADLDLK